jgi:hypothetical protein
MTATVKGRIDWSLQRDKDGHREYRLRSHVVTDDVEDGPERVYFAAGAPAIGAPWTFGNDNDAWAFCWPTATVTPIVTREPNNHWILENLFSTRPLNRCQDDAIESPLLEPDRVSGSFVKYTREALWDRFGNLILSSSHEQIRGLERDANRPSVIIEQNEASLGLATFSEMIDTVNDATLWGLGERKIKLSNVSWERKLYGTCTFYYTRRLEFDIRFDGFDFNDVADAGFKVFDDELYEDNPTNRADPRKYKVCEDGRGNKTPTKVLLDGSGSQLTDATSPVFLPEIELYAESNFLLLGIPTSF